MELAAQSATNFSHGFTLLRELNLQREMGQFCDCVLQLRIHPGRLFLAHKSVLAAFSPVLASLFPRHGALVDLNFPYLTPETLDILLDYIYTGTLPPQSREESVLSAAFYLQIEQLQQALRCRSKILAKNSHSAQDKLKQKRRLVEGQPQDGTPLASPSYYTYGSDPPVSSPPSCEVVPVIRHVSTSGNNKMPQLSCSRNRSSTFKTEETGSVSDVKHPKELSNEGYPQSSHELQNSSLLDHFFEPAQSKQVKLLVVLSEGSLNNLPGVVAEKVSNRFSCSSDGGEFQSTLPKNPSQTMATLHSNMESRDQCIKASKDLSSETESSQNSNHSCAKFKRSDSNRCVSDIDSIQSFNPFDSGKSEDLEEILSDTFSDKTSYSTCDDRSHLCGQFTTEDCPESQPPLGLDNSRKPDTIEMTCDKRTSGLDVWHEINQPYAQKSLFERRPLEVLTAQKVDIEENQRTDHVNYEFPKNKKDFENAFQGQLHYQCMLERRHCKADSSDSSDSDRAILVSNTEAKDSTTGLETIDMTDISLSTGQPSKSPGERSTTHPFQCSMCERAFSQRGSLNRHMRSHLGVRPYSCPRCSMTFSRQYRVTEHMRVHQRSCEAPTEGHLQTAAAGMDV